MARMLMNLVFAVAILATTAFERSAIAQSWPRGPVRLVIPTGAGSGADITARLLAEGLSKRWQQPVVVDNRPGGDGVLAAVAMINARDEHTLLFGPSSSFTAHAFVHDKIPYDAAELIPLARVTSTLVSIAAPASLQANTLAEFVALARNRPGTLNWAGVTGASELVFSGFVEKSGLDMTRVSYRNPSEALGDLSAGRIHAFYTAIAIVQGQVQGGKVKMLALATRDRSDLAPGLPTVFEAGYPELEFDGLTGMFGNGSMSEALRERIGADVLAAASELAQSGRLASPGQIVQLGSAREFYDSIERQRVRLAEIAKRRSQRKDR